MADNFKGLDENTLKSAEGIKSSMKDISLAARDLNKELVKTRSYLASYETQFNDISKSASKVADLQKKAQSTSKATVDAVKEQNKQLNIIKTLNIQIDNLYKAAAISTKATKYNLEKQALTLAAARDNAQQLAADFSSIANDSAKLDKSTRFFTLLSDVAKDIPGLRQFSTPFEKASEAARKQVISNVKNKEIQERLSKLTEKELENGINLSRRELKKRGLTDITGNLKGKEAAAALREAKETYKVQNATMVGAKTLGSSLGEFLKGPVWITALIGAAKFFVDAMFAADKRVTDIAKNLMISKDAAAGVYNNLKLLKPELNTIYNTTKDITEAFTDLIDLTEFAVIANKEMIETQIILTKNLGLSKEEAFGVQEAFIASNVEADKGKDIIYDQIAAFANQNKLIISGKKLFTDIAKTSKLIQINFNGNLNELTKTTLEAKKLGLNLDQVKRIGESLLDFEQSISSELEAELLTGRDINLEKARLYALNHDIAGLTQEIANQGITIETFAGMNVIQQQAIAKTLGMSAEEMGDMLYKQKVINKAGGDYLKNLKEQAKISGNARLMERVATIEQGILSGKTAEQAEKSASAQEKFNQSLEQAKEIFTDFVDGGTLNELADAIKGLVNFITGGKSEERAKANKANNYISNLSEDQKKEYESGLKTKLKNEMAWQQLLNDIAQPVTAFTTNFGAKEARAKTQLEGEYYGDWMKSHKIIPAGKEFAKGGIVTSRIDNATIGEAGPEAVIPLNQLMNEFKEMRQILTAILNKEGTIMLNGTKMGTAMAVGSYKVQ
jgi:hypothetical protein